MEEEERKPRLNLMLDIETLGKKPGSVILSVTIKSFEPETNEVGKDANTYNIDVLSSLLNHFFTDYDTEEWWKARRGTLKEMQHDTMSVEQAMNEIYELLKGLNKDYEVYIWGRGVASFDLPVLDEAMRRIIGPSYKCPWEYWQAMDVRTLFRACKWAGMEPQEEETVHTSSADVDKQIREVQQAWQFLTRAKETE